MFIVLDKIGNIYGRDVTELALDSKNNIIGCRSLARV